MTRGGKKTNRGRGGAWYPGLLQQVVIGVVCYRHEPVVSATVGNVTATHRQSNNEPRDAVSLTVQPLVLGPDREL